MKKGDILHGKIHSYWESHQYENALTEEGEYVELSDVHTAMDEWLKINKKEHSFYLISFDESWESLQAKYFSSFDHNYQENGIILSVGYDKIGLAKKFSTWMEAFEFSDGIDFDIVSNLYVEDIFRNHGQN